MSAELVAIASNPSLIESAADPEVFIIQACERGKAWLREALDHGEIDQIAEIKATAEAIRIYTISKNYGEDAQVSATELVRRAERGIGRAVRKGQEDGVITKKGDYHGNQHAASRQGTDSSLPPKKESPRKYVGHGAVSEDIYDMVDGVSDDDFDQVIAEATAESNLSRANIARKARARAAGQPSPASPAVKSHNTGRPPRGKSSRRPLTEYAKDTGWQLRKDVEKLERIFADDRYSYNKQQVATHLRGHLQYAVQVCQDLLDRIGNAESQRVPTSANTSQHDDTGD